MADNKNGQKNLTSKFCGKFLHKEKTSIDMSNSNVQIIQIKLLQNLDVIVVVKNLVGKMCS